MRRPRYAIEPYVPFVLVGWVLANFGWTLAFGFDNDDFGWIQHATLYPSDWLLHTFLIPPAWTNFVFRPVVQLSFALNALVGGLSPVTYHAVNVALHALNTVLVWRLATLVTGSRRIALLVGLIFSVHPTMTDAVAWISGRTELVCTAFYVGAVLAHLRGRRPLALLLAALALLSKESAVSLPLAIIAAERLLGRGGGRGCLRYFGLVVAYLMLRAVVVDTYAMGVIGFSPWHNLDWENVAYLARSKITLLGQYFFEPFALHGFRRSLGALIAAAVLVGWCIRDALRPRARAVRFAMAWTLITLLPYLGWRTFQSWYVYMAVIGVVMLWTLTGLALLRRLPRGRYRARLAAAAVIVWLAASVWTLQVNNEHERRAGVASLAVVNALAAAVPSPAARTLVVISGLERLRYGADPWVGRAALIFGLPEALRLWQHDWSLDVEFGEPGTAARGGDRPIIYLRWDESAQQFHPQS